MTPRKYERALRRFMDTKLWLVGDQNSFIEGRLTDAGRKHFGVEA
jgi:hypothetical protein